jgi:type IV pilus assembly protein PilV
MFLNSSPAKRRHCASARAASSRGFSLIEVMIAVLVVSLGLLGVAKLEAVSYSSTTVANKRSLAAFQAANLAAAMHVNRGYWSNTDPAGAKITLQGTAFTVVAGAVNLAASLGAVAVVPPSAAIPLWSAGTCANPGAPCLVTDVAAYDLLNWANSLNAVLPDDTATILCNNSSPVACTIQINWGESSVATTSAEAVQQAANPNAAFENPSYTLYVQP